MTQQEAIDDWRRSLVGADPESKSPLAAFRAGWEARNKQLKRFRADSETDEGFAQDLQCLSCDARFHVDATTEENMIAKLVPRCPQCNRIG